MEIEEHSSQLELHIKTGDYFRLISTVLGFVQETVHDCSCGLAPELVPLEVEAVKNIRGELEYLHEKYEIVPRRKETAGA